VARGFGEFLRNEGFTVLEAADLSEAPLACRDCAEPVDLSIINTKNGIELARQMAARFPMRVLFVGDSEKMNEGHRLAGLRYSYLQKPFTTEALLKSVRMILPRGTEVGSREQFGDLGSPPFCRR